MNNKTKQFLLTLCKLRISFKVGKYFVFVEWNVDPAETNVKKVNTILKINKFSWCFTNLNAKYSY